MLKTPIARGVALATLGATLAIPSMAQAAFIEDTKAGLELRNFYFSRDFREDAGQSKQEEWAQGFLLRVESGYTEGTVGFGVDAIGLLGVKLDSGGGRYSNGAQLLPGDGDTAADDFSEVGMTAKAKMSETVLKIGHDAIQEPGRCQQRQPPATCIDAGCQPGFERNRRLDSRYRLRQSQQPACIER